MIENGLDSKSLAWYESDLKEVPEPAKTLLEKYSKVPSDKVVQHVNSMVSISISGAKMIFTDPTKI